jgi:enamine deaminase RidA (YjgF/YER057c/UK114 family)
MSFQAYIDNIETKTGNTLFADHKPADVVVGIAALSPGYLIEVDAIAVIDHIAESYTRSH